MTNPRILLLGGHGKVSLLMTPKLISRSWDVISVIRNPSQKDEIVSAGSKGPGKIEVMIESLADVKSEGDAKKILEKARPDWVVWSAGAGGKGGKEMTYAIDRDACSYFIRSSVNMPSVKKFLLVSALLCRRDRAAWWNDESWANVRKINEEVMPDYYKAKLSADEVLTVLGEENKDFGYIVLRPGTLSDDPESGKVVMGKTQAKGSVSRADVAEVAATLLEKEGARGWFDLLGGGEEQVAKEVERVVGGKVDSKDGESVEAMRKDLKL